jgi:hypothetical protein
MMLDGIPALVVLSLLLATQDIIFWQAIPLAQPVPPSMLNA